jgi:uncharacterized protein (DUF1015 family)
MLAYPAAAALDALLERAAASRAAIDVTADDGVRHQLWVIDDAQTIAALTRAVEALPALYIADGHHRAAAAFRVAEARGGGAGGADGSGYFLAVLLPENQMTILDYNRVLRDLNGRSAAELLAEIRRRCTVEPSDRPVRPMHAQEFGMVLAGRWYRLQVRPADRAEPGEAHDAGPVARLPVTLLARTIIEPLFGITDQRTDQRIDFVGGGSGLAELERLVTSGEMAAAFALYPTQMRDLMAVADAGAVMPPKSTWFEPKLADGMVSHVLD